MGHRWSCETKPPPGGDKFDGSCVHVLRCLSSWTKTPDPSHVFIGWPDKAARGRRGWGASVGGVQGLSLLWNVGAERRGHQRNVSGVFLCQARSHKHTHTQLHVPRFLSPSFHPSLTCVRTVGSVRWPRSAWASPKSRPTPFAASATAKTPGTCWASSLVPHGESGFRGWVPGVRVRVLGSGVGSQGLIIVVYIRCCWGLFSGRKWTKRTGSWPCCCTLTSASPLAAKMPSKLWWMLAPHCWRTLNSTKPQAVACSHTGPRWTFPGYYLLIQHSVFMPRCSMPTHRPVSWIKVLYLVIKTIYMT